MVLVILVNYHLHFIQFQAILQQGDSVKNKRHRRGILHCPNGSKYDGEWNENVREGHRTYTYAGANISFEIFR
jgi:hypothetical protein